MVASELSRNDDLRGTITMGIAGHERCDLLVTRVSGGLIEVGCPGMGPNLHETYGCPGHPEMNWIRVEWLRILEAAQDARSADIKYIRERPELRCWNQTRMNRLRYELER
jgi:hypothetical protein